MIKRLRYLPILTVICIATAAARQLPSFEVASVKPSLATPGPRSVLWLPGGRMTATALTLKQLIRSAYVGDGDGIQLIDQIIGGPPWADTDRFDIIAKLGEMSGDADAIARQRRDMLKSLLAERFGLRLHADTRAMPVLDLVLLRKDGQPGPDLKVSTCLRSTVAPNPPTADGRPCVLSRLVGMSPEKGLTMGFEGMTMREFAASIVGFPEIGRPVRDRTGLTGAFDLQYTLPMPTPSDAGLPGGGQSPTANGDSGILRALREQLGLKLEGRRDQVDVLVIDSAMRPIQD